MKKQKTSNLLPVFLSQLIGIEDVRCNTAELFSKIIGHELLKVHNRTVVREGKPAFLLPNLITSDVARITTIDLFSDTIIHP